ncbi:hypothetical protein [Kosakonia phage 305]|uniref:Uncharacterized protein n=1 Tax=Kosakonia phage 305 TaxID=2863193 RepID=A0AAE8BIS3_9CAUD|nr:hypothetical protein PP421_gp153 [Kosakonia phage 305]QYN80304.1 hypothetical protein [Kosakonia phage 305]
MSTKFHQTNHKLINFIPEHALIHPGSRVLNCTERLDSNQVVR